MSTISTGIASPVLTPSPWMTAGMELLAWMRSRMAAYRGWRERRAAAAGLGALDDHLLRDIGIDRSEIMSLSHCGATDTTRRRRG